MIYTTEVVKNLFPSRKVKRVTEMFRVFCVVFEAERPQFVGKKAIIEMAQAMNADDFYVLKVLGEWQITEKKAPKAVSPELMERWAKRARRCCIKDVRIEGNKVRGIIPSDKHEASVARTSAKEMGFRFVPCSCEVELEVVA